MRSLRRFVWNQWVGGIALYAGGMALLVCLMVAVLDKRNFPALLPAALLAMCKALGLLALLIGGAFATLVLGGIILQGTGKILRRVPRFRRLDSDTLFGISFWAFQVLLFLYLFWPTPYRKSVRELPQRGTDDGAPTAQYEVQVNRFTGTVWAKTTGGWKRFQGKPVYESQLGHDLRYPDEAADRADHESQSDEERRDMRY